jgi:hypothetical protein
MLVIDIEDLEYGSFFLVINLFPYDAYGLFYVIPF